MILALTPAVKCRKSSFFLVFCGLSAHFPSKFAAPGGGDRDFARAGAKRFRSVERAEGHLRRSSTAEISTGSLVIDAAAPQMC
jgi:hypothetical protein